MKDYKLKAKEFFKKRDFKKAFEYYSKAFMQNPNDLDIKIGILLCDIAESDEFDAFTLFELYEKAREEGISSIEFVMDSILKDSSYQDDYQLDEFDKYNDLMFDMSVTNGIEYKDFKIFLNNRESFKIALEDLLFSTKIIIYKKEDFIEFISLLLDNGFEDFALNYLENAISLYPYEIFFQQRLDQIEG